jgi:hypothetical protein
VRRLMIWIGGLFVAAAIAAGAFNLIALAAQHTFSVRTTYAGIDSLRVDSGDGDVHLTAAPAGSPVVLVAHVTEGFGSPHRHATEPRPGELAIGYSCGTIVDCSVSYDVSVPAGASVTATSGDGDVGATALVSPHVKLESGNGDVNGSFSTPPTSLVASSGDGDVTLTVPNTTYALRATSGNGNVNDQSISIDDHAPRRIVASSGNGDVTVTPGRLGWGGPGPARMWFRPKCMRTCVLTRFEWRRPVAGISWPGDGDSELSGC